MSNEPDGEDGAADAKAGAGAKATSSDKQDHGLPEARVVKDELEIPPTRQVAAAEPPERPSALQLHADPVGFPDDGPLAHMLREVDRIAGVIEQGVLFGLLAVIVLVGAVQAVMTKALGESLLWSFDVIRAGTFAIAMIAAAFASKHASHLSMDMITRWISARARLILRVVLGMFTIFATSLLVYSGLHLRAQVASEGGSHTIPIDAVATLIPLGAGLIIFHTALHLLINLDYIRRGKLPPERAPSAH